MAGPWFTVLEDGSSWSPLGDVWWSDGATDGVGRLEARVTLEGPDEA